MRDRLTEGGEETADGPPRAFAIGAYAIKKTGRPAKYRKWRALTIGLVQRSSKMTNTKDVLDGHLRSFAEKSVDGLVADYAADAVLFIPGQPLLGPSAIRPFFQELVAEFAKPGASFLVREQWVEGDYAYILWSGETADNWYEAATDTFVIRDGKIVAQSFAAKIIPKQRFEVFAACL